MTHFGVICPTGSHLTTCFSLAFEVQRRGHRITFLNVLDVQDQVLAASFEFRAIGETEFPVGSQARLVERRGKLSGMAALKDTLKAVEQDMRVILQEAPAIVQSEGIQALLVDQCSPVGGTVADFLNLPFISLCNALPLNREISLPPPFTSWQYSSTWGAKLRNQAAYTLSTILARSIRKLTTEYRRQWKLRPHSHLNDNFSRLAQLSQQPAEFEFPRADLPPHFHFTGPYHSSIGRENVSFPWNQLTGQPLVYASLGTIQNQLFPVFEMIAAACVGLDVQLVISLGGGMSPEAMSTLPGVPLVVRYAPQLELLKKAALTITHAGLNTALESLTHGVPMVAIPIANDQPGVAARIVWSGAGEMIPVSRLTVDDLRSTIHKVLTQDSYKAQALRLRSAIQNSGGVQQAANVIESVIATKNQFLEVQVNNPVAWRSYINFFTDVELSHTDLSARRCRVEFIAEPHYQRMLSKTKLPKGSQAPQWLQKIQYTQNTIAYMEMAAQRCGDIFSAPVIGNQNVVFVSNPQALQRIFSGDTKQFIAPPNQLLQPLVGDYSIFALEGSRHRRERRLLMPPFHGERMQTYGELICELVDKAMSSLSIETQFSARQLAQNISLAVILKVVFGIDQEERFHHLKSLIINLADSLQSPFIGGLLFFPSLQKDWGTRSPWGYLRSLQRQIREVIYAEISDRRHQNHIGSDILSLLMSARDETGQPMSDAELHDELFTLLLAGYETTASTIAWALYWIHRHPQVGEKLLVELHQLGNAPDPIALVQLPYLTAVCNESLRLFPVAALTMPREVKDPVELMGYQLEPGTRVYGCVYLTHQRPDLYPEPKLFKPERFLERQFSPYEFLPFGGGTRRCIGEALAQFEMKLVIATLLSHYRLALADQSPEYPQRRGVTFTPARGVQMILKEKIVSY